MVRARRKPADRSRQPQASDEEASPSLAQYERMRDFSRTTEPPPAVAARSGPLTYTIQKHAARRLHYDLRLEMNGVLISWPIPQGPSLDPDARRLAIQTEDHPYDYGTFEGVIPAGEYGAGEVIVWDAGTYTLVNERGLPDFRDRQRTEQQALSAWRRGHLRVFLNGRKLKGGWTLSRTTGEGSGSEWLFIKRRDGLEDPARDITLEDHSVLSGLRIEDIQAGAQPPPGRRASLRAHAAGLAGAIRAPMPEAYEPMLPTLTDELFQRHDWLYEPKLDGYRVLAFVQDGQARLWSRHGQAYEERYPSIARALAAQPLDAAIFDGEVIALGPDGRLSFQRLQSGSGELHYYGFDLLYLDGFDVRGVRLTDRKALLHAVLAPIGGLQEVPGFEDGPALFAAAQNNGLEGIVAKKRDSVYEPGRRVRTWLKIKTARTDEFVIAGYTTGSGRRSETLGSLILGSYDESGKLRYAGHVGTGFDEAGLEQLLNRLRPLRRARSPFDEPVPRGGDASRSGGAGVWVEPKLVAEIKFSERTDDGRLRHPVFVRLRDDKSPGEARPQVVVDPPPSESPVAPPDQVAAALGALETSADRISVWLDGYELRLSRLNKEFWPAYGERRPLLKRDLVRYYLQIAPHVLPHLRDRPVTMTRFPDGIGGQKFYQKSPKETAPPFVQRFMSFSEHNNADDEYFVCNNVATLVWLSQLADLELHVTHTRISNEPDAPRLPTSFTGSVERIERSTLNYPDFLVVDLDPYIYSGAEPRGAEPELNRPGFARAVEVARWFRELLEGIGLHPFLKTTGKTGLHLYAPIARTLDYDSVRAIAETLALQLVRAHPGLVTTEWAVEARRGKVFLDYNMNRRSASLAAVYSPRATAWAGVSTPLRWDELDEVYPTEFDVLSVPERLARLGELWAHILDARVDLAAALSR
ncbi:MAG: non-homologous end-joining DNA ligase [Chloroflexota bacterium]|nr:non-homologous end-joining DNA ligase [Chloroflexota bacterium]